MRRVLGVLAGLGTLVAGARAQSVTPGPTPFRYDFPNAYFDYGGVALPRAVAGGYKGTGTINAQGLYVNGLAVFPTSGTIADGHCVQAVGGNLVDFGAACGGTGGSSSSSSNVVTTRTVTGTAPATITNTDYLVCLDGPTEADLEASPTIGRTHVIVDCRANGGAAISIVPAGSTTINGATTLPMTQNSGQAKQAVTLTYLANYSWRVN